MIYILFFLLTFILATFITKRKQSLITVIIVVALFIGLSYPAGGDWIGYFLNYDCIINDVCSPGFSLFEPGYEFIVSIVGYAGFQSIIIFIAIINALMIYCFATKFENGALIIIAIMCMFLWSLYIEAIRQAVAFSCVAFSIVHLYNKNIKKFIFLIAIASSFHITAIVCFVLLVPLYSMRISKVIGYSLIVFSAAFIVVSNSILVFIVSILPAGFIAAEKLSFYLHSEQYKPQLSLGSGTALDILLVFLIAISFRRIKQQNLGGKLYFNNVVFLGVCLYISFGILAGKMMPVMTRIGWYGFPFVLILLYSNLGRSLYFEAFKYTKKPAYSRLLIYAYFILQIVRPFTYDYSSYNILHQETILQNLNELDDQSLRVAAKKKCQVLSNLGYGFLCSI
jgi:hypothetical protein